MATIKLIFESILLKLRKVHPHGNIFMSLKYVGYSGNEENNISFNQIRLQTIEMLMLKTVKPCGNGKTGMFGV